MTTRPTQAPYLSYSFPLNRMEDPFILKSACYVHLKPKGETCNRLSAGTQVKVVQLKEEWIKITWRNGKKKGWIQTE